ncbi:hypothetical protein AvCA_31470 [Azotobacter vinelandii CA]|uniref:Uncharacterized protein n=2 Tax=Azotobacter vinelandii TaxID=354 RepID=C1DNV7_AZOVD|nr:hypothetical protein Avin_31470 [Azotobacter vinelandii DJ]AGK14727.1 hypothetical protein AvCA_31470 [Azotobacter vinelandii CA]AGK21116.1 hypothetical protein AvCA6_31470 [Azotobacter vinelandii CA6]
MPRLLPDIYLYIPKRYLIFSISRIKI